jgi:hypothetical protein
LYDSVFLADQQNTVAGEYTETAPRPFPSTTNVVERQNGKCLADAVPARWISQAKREYHTAASNDAASECAQ